MLIWCPDWWFSYHYNQFPAPTRKVGMGNSVFMFFWDNASVILFLAWFGHVCIFKFAPCPILCSCIRSKCLMKNPKSAEGSDPLNYCGKIIECAWDSDKQEWIFKRVRTDKSTPNDFNTYKKVLCQLLWFLSFLFSLNLYMI